MCPQLECGVQHIVKCRMVTSAFPGIAQKSFLVLLNTLVQIFTHHVMDFGAKARQIQKTQRHPLPGRSVRGVVATDDEPSIEPLARLTCQRCLRQSSGLVIAMTVAPVMQLAPTLRMSFDIRSAQRRGGMGRGRSQICMCTRLEARRLGVGQQGIHQCRASLLHKQQTAA